jgi:hypothetical protein
MKFQAIILGGITLASLAIPALCDSYRNTHCWCANSQRIGYVFTMDWDSEQYGHKHLNDSGSIRRSNRRQDFVGQRCDEGSATERCINILDPQKFNKLGSGFPATVKDICQTSEDGIEFCGTYDAVRINGKYKRFDSKETRTTKLLDCLQTCKDDWSGGEDPSTIDLCSYTSNKNGPLYGHRIPMGSKPSKSGGLKPRGSYPRWCVLKEVDYFKGFELGDTRLKSP